MFKAYCGMLLTIWTAGLQLRVLARQLRKTGLDDEDVQEIINDAALRMLDTLMPPTQKEPRSVLEQLLGTS